MPQDFSGQNLRGHYFKGQDLAGANFRDADLSKANLSEADLSGAILCGAILSKANFSRTILSQVNLSQANLSNAKFWEANLSGAKLWEANLMCTNLSGAILSQANLSNANLSNANLRGAILSNANLSQANLKGAILNSANFNEATLSNADLSEAILTNADLSEADFRKADLSRAILNRTIVLATDFTGANFTGVCIEDWNINSATKLNDINCLYIYLKSDQQERRPSSGDFAPGEFTKLFQKTLETVDLIFRDGIDWQAFLISFQKLQVECSGEELSIQAIESKNDGTFVIRVNVPYDANKAEIEKYLKREYNLAVVAIEEKYKIKLQAKDEQIAIYRQHNTNLAEIVKLMAERPITNIIDVTAKAESEFMSEGSKQVFNNNLQGAQFGGGLVNADTVTANQIGGNITNYNPEQKQNLAEAAADIQQLLNQLSQTYPTATTSEKMSVVAKAVDEIESNPTLKARVIGALKAGGTEALKELIDNPLINILLASIDGWQEAE
ncbi:pentapeptide repeat-containing protein [Anabaena sp. CCY 9910]|uniref:pentapeptide repeat-containing protein n=1 Tax=Anabaena sp. CCY 9910 TaxID=3103870 RepID=UPI0039E1B951